MEEWNTDQICDWLSEIGLAQKYVERCREEEINGESLLMLCSSDEELKGSLGLKLGPFTILKRKIKPHYESYCKVGASPCTSTSSKNECALASSVSVEAPVSNYKPPHDTSEENIAAKFDHYQQKNFDNLRGDSKSMDDNKKELNQVLAKSEDGNQSAAESTMVADSEKNSVLPVMSITDPATEQQQPSDEDISGYGKDTKSEIAFIIDSSSGNLDNSCERLPLNEPNILAEDEENPIIENEPRLEKTVSNISLFHDSEVDAQGKQRIKAATVSPEASFHDAASVTNLLHAIGTDNEGGVYQFTRTTVDKRTHTLKSDASNTNTRPTEKYASILTTKLNINFKDATQVSKEPSRKVILNVAFVKQNKQTDFDKAFTFLIMTRNDTKLNIRKLWDTISKQSSRWSLLLNIDKYRFGGNVLETGWVNWVALATVPLEELSKSCLVLIVDKTLVSEDISEYFCCLDTNETQYISTKIKFGDPYHALFETRDKGKKVSLEINMNFHVSTFPEILLMAHN